jgi:hypothetical protein
MGGYENIKSFEMLPQEDYLVEKQKDEGMFEMVAGQSVSDISPMPRSDKRLDET